MQCLPANPLLQLHLHYCNFQPRLFDAISSCVLDALRPSPRAVMPRRADPSFGAARLAARPEESPADRGMSCASRFRDPRSRWRPIRRHRRRAWTFRRGSIDHFLVLVRGRIDTAGTAHRGPRDSRGLEAVRRIDNIILDLMIGCRRVAGSWRESVDTLIAVGPALRLSSSGAVPASPLKEEWHVRGGRLARDEAAEIISESRAAGWRRLPPYSSQRRRPGCESRHISNTGDGEWIGFGWRTLDRPRAPRNVRAR